MFVSIIHTRNTDILQSILSIQTLPFYVHLLKYDKNYLDSQKGNKINKKKIV